ncbi:MAG: DUF4384 domain-containing protein [Sulfurovaceae bacterium]|nr:DUF4384 domain-containing protein [Sulfurovaceae bacterium]
MKIRRTYQISLLISTILITMGCSHNTNPVPQKTQTAISKPAPVIHKPTGISISELNSGGVSNLKITTTKNKYHIGEPIQFGISTNNKSGYLYIIYVNKKGQTSLLYPNAKAPLTELTGEFVFPKDFGNMKVRASKDCKDCKEDKTTIYALLSKKPILDINNITQSTLSNFVGEHSESSTKPKTKTKALKFDDGSKDVDNSNIKVGKVTFSVVD